MFLKEAPGVTKRCISGILLLSNSPWLKRHVIIPVAPNRCHNMHQTVTSCLKIYFYMIYRHDNSCKSELGIPVLCSLKMHFSSTAACTHKHNCLHAEINNLKALNLQLHRNHQRSELLYYWSFVEGNPPVTAVPTSQRGSDEESVFKAWRYHAWGYVISW